MGGNSKNSNPKFTRERQIFHYTFLFDAYEVIEGIDFNFFDVDIDNAVEQNHQLRHPSIRTPERDKFLSLVKNGKSISYATFCIFKKRIIKRNIKKVLIKLHLMEVQH